MFKNVIIGVDEHGQGQDPIALARWLAEPHAKLSLAHVYPGAATAWPGATVAVGAEERDAAMQLLSEARAKADIDAELLTIAASSPARGLHILAQQEGADLLVVGSCHRGVVGRVALGDDANASLNGAPCAVAVAPAGYAKDADVMREIGVGYNDSRESHHAVAIARALAEQHGARLSAMEVLSLPAHLFAGTAAAVDVPITDMVREGRERVAQLGDVEAHAVYGNPAEELGLYSSSLDLLVVGSRDYGPVGRLMHGSTSRNLARNTRSPLLVLTRAAREMFPRVMDADGDRIVAAQ